MRNLVRENLISRLKAAGWSINEAGNVPRAQSSNGKVKLALFHETVQVTFSVGYNQDVSNFLKVLGKYPSNNGKKRKV